jgi:hypothetical protein
MCLKETYSKVHIGKNMSEAFSYDLRQGVALLPLLYNFSLEYPIRKVQENVKGLKLKVTHQLPIYAGDVKYTR